MRQVVVRLINLFFGLILYALGIIISIKANIGYAPWDVFHVGLSNTLGVSFGIISIFVGIVVVIIVTVFGEKLGLGTILNVVVIGTFIEIILKLDLIPMASNFLVGAIMLVIGMFTISLGSFFYIKSAFGVGPRDNLMVVMAKKTKIPVGICRCIVELTVTLIGWKLGGMVWFGTALFVVTIGLCIQITFKVLRFDVTKVQHESLSHTYKAWFGKKNNNVS